MLIQISNRCDEGCPHCLQDSREDGEIVDSIIHERIVINIEKE